MKAITIDGIFGRVLTEEIIEKDWGDQVERLEKEHNFTHEAAMLICAIAEKFNVCPLSEKAEFISEILELGLPANLGYDLSDKIKEYYR